MRRPFVSVVGSGAASVAVTFGFARYGYGLLLPDIRADLALGSAALGLIGALSYGAYLAATASIAILAQRVSARAIVVAGLLFAAAGCLTIAVSRGPIGLAAGLLVAGVSSGLVFPPFSDLVARHVAPPRRGRALSAISSGTGWGVALAVPVALLAGSAWRTAWLVYAAVAMLVALVAVRALGADARAARQAPAGPAGDALPLRLSWFVCPRSGPLLAGALLVGLGSSIFWTFAIDHVVTAGDMEPARARLLLVVVGVASLAAIATGDLVQRLGGRTALRMSALALGASVTLLGAAPGSWAAVSIAALLFGAAYNSVLAVQGIWSARVFADRPSTGLAAVMFALGVGLLAGPVAGGAVADAAGMTTVFVAGGLVVALAGALSPREELAVASPRLATGATT